MGIDFDEKISSRLIVVAVARDAALGARARGSLIEWHRHRDIKLNGDYYI